MRESFHPSDFDRPPSHFQKYVPPGARFHKIINVPKASGGTGRNELIEDNAAIPERAKLIEDVAGTYFFRKNQPAAYHPATHGPDFKPDSHRRHKDVIVPVREITLNNRFS